jgi:hypothetical protein
MKEDGASGKIMQVVNVVVVRLRPHACILHRTQGRLLQSGLQRRVYLATRLAAQSRLFARISIGYATCLSSPPSHCRLVKAKTRPPSNGLFD